MPHRMTAMVLVTAGWLAACSPTSREALQPWQPDMDGWHYPEHTEGLGVLGREANGSRIGPVRVTAKDLDLVAQDNWPVDYSPLMEVVQESRRLMSDRFLDYAERTHPVFEVFSMGEGLLSPREDEGNGVALTGVLPQNLCLVKAENLKEEAYGINAPLAERCVTASRFLYSFEHAYETTDPQAQAALQTLLEDWWSRVPGAKERTISVLESYGHAVTFAVDGPPVCLGYQTWKPTPKSYRLQRWMDWDDTPTRSTHDLASVPYADSDGCRFLPYRGPSAATKYAKDYVPEGVYDTGMSAPAYVPPAPEAPGQERKPLRVETEPAAMPAPDRGTAPPSGGGNDPGASGMPAPPPPADGMPSLTMPQL